MDVLVLSHVLDAGVDRDHQVVLGRAVGVDHHDPLLLELPGHRPGFAEVPAGPGEDVADLRAGAVAVVGQCLHEDRHAARPVALVDDRLDRGGVGVRARPLCDRALDVLLRHPRVLRLLNRVCERRVAGWITAAVAPGDLDRAGELRELGATAGVGDGLLVLDLRPLGMTGHAASLGMARGSFGPG